MCYFCVLYWLMLSILNSSITLSLRMTINITSFLLHPMFPNKINAFSDIFFPFPKILQQDHFLPDKSSNPLSFPSSLSQSISSPRLLPSFKGGYLLILFLRMEGMFFLRDNNIIMSTVTLRSIVVYLEQSVDFQLDLSLKLAIGTQIFKFHELRWNPHCRRWQREADAVFPWSSVPFIELELYHMQESPVPVVVAEGTIPAASISSALQREIRISLLLDGLYVGCLFCEISDGGEGVSQGGTFFFLHKIEIILTEQVDNCFTLTFRNNLEPFFEKKFQMHTRSKTLFPNLKIPVKMSDVATIALQHCSVNIKQVRFVMDSVRRGKTSTFEAWLRNSMKNKVGVIKLQYFLENMFLDNDRQMFARNGIFPTPKKRQSILVTEQDKDRIKRSVIIKQLEEADCRIRKLGTNVRRMIKDMDNKENRPKMGRQYRGTLTLIQQQ